MPVLQMIRYALLFGIPLIMLILSVIFTIRVKKTDAEEYFERKTRKTVCVIFIGLTILAAATAMTSEFLYYIVLLIGVPMVSVVWFFISLALYFDVPQGVDRSSEIKMLKISAAAVAVSIVLVIAVVAGFVAFISQY